MMLLARSAARSVAGVSSSCRASAVRLQDGRRAGAACLWRSSCRGVVTQASELPSALPEGATLLFPHRQRAVMVHEGDERLRRTPGIRVAIIGASGNSGRQIANALVAKRPRFSGLGKMTVQFLGQRGDYSLGTLIGLCSELRDAFDESCPDFEVVCEMAAVEADIIVMVAGANMSPQYKTFAEVARANMDIFHNHAEGMLKRNRKALVLIVSNPAEYAVDAFVSCGFSSERVVGFGAYLDTMRFRREIASELGVSRQHISGLSLGKHGIDVVPCWSTVKGSPFLGDEVLERLEVMKQKGLERTPRDTEKTRELAREVRMLAEDHESMAALAIINKQPADLRASLRRYASYFGVPLYPRMAVGEKVANLMLDLVDGREILFAAQVHVRGDEFLGIRDQAIGAPVGLSGQGVRVIPIKLDPREEEAIHYSAQEAQRLSQSVGMIRSMRLRRGSPSGAKLP